MIKLKTLKTFKNDKNQKKEDQNEVSIIPSEKKIKNLI